MTYKLFVYGTLRRGKLLNFLLANSPLIAATEKSNVFSVTLRRLWLLDAVELLCGYVRVSRNGFFIYKRIY